MDANEEAEPLAQRSGNEPAGRRLWPRWQETQSAQPQTRAQEVAVRQPRPPACVVVAALSGLLLPTRLAATVPGETRNANSLGESQALGRNE